MAIVPVPTWEHLNNIKPTEFVAHSSQSMQQNVRNPNEQPRLILNEKDSTWLEQVLSESRVLITEGISGSGKDTFQKYLKTKIRDRDVYAYSEGEVLHSWKQLQIKGILELRVRFMKLFANHIKDTIEHDSNAFFLLNRFHLSTYASTIIQEPRLRREYDEVVKTLKSLPVHIFVLQLAQDEIEERSSHPERPSAWQKFQKQIVENYDFRERLERQQRLILEAARRQQIPYCTASLSYDAAVGDGRVEICKTFPVVNNRTRLNIKPPSKKPAVSTTL